MWGEFQEGITTSTANLIVAMRQRTSLDRSCCTPTSWRGFRHESTTIDTSLALPVSSNLCRCRTQPGCKQGTTLMTQSGGQTCSLSLVSMLVFAEICFWIGRRGWNTPALLWLTKVWVDRWLCGSQVEASVLAPFDRPDLDNTEARQPECSVPAAVTSWPDMDQ